MKHVLFVLAIGILFISLNGCSSHYYGSFDYPATTTVYTTPTYYRYPSSRTESTHSVTVKGEGYSYYRLDQNSSGTSGGYYNYNYGYPGGYSNSNVVINEYYDLDKYNGGAIGYGNPLANNYGVGPREQKKGESNRSVIGRYNGSDMVDAGDGNNNIARSKSDYVSINGRGNGYQEQTSITPTRTKETQQTTPAQREVTNVSAKTRVITSDTPSLAQLFDEKDKKNQNEAPSTSISNEKTSKKQNDKSGDRSTQRERIKKN